MSGKIKRDGKACDGRHPKICKRLRIGGFGRNGCNKGAKCEFLHPKVCKGSASKDKTCPDPVSCKFFHINGTKLVVSPPTAKQNEAPAESAMQGRSYATAVIGANPPPTTGKKQPDESALSPTVMQDFLQDLIREMKEGFSVQAKQMQSLMLSMQQRNTNSPMKAAPGEMNLPSQENSGFPLMYQLPHPSQRFCY